MKKVVFVLAVVFLAGSVLSAVDFYGNARIGYWYDMQDKDLTGSESRTKLHYDLFGTSRFGANFAGEAYTGKIEVSMARTGVNLRQVWGEYDFGMLKLLIGQYYTGFFDLPNQATSIVSACENLMIGYGLTYDSRNPMIKLSMDNGAYLIFMEPKLVDPAGVGGVDALLPKINLGMRFKFDNLMLHPTFGINMSNYNKDFNAAEMDESVLAYAAALTAKYCMGDLTILAQGSLGQNVADYGILSGATGGNASWDPVESEVINATTTAGYLQVSYQMGEKTCLTAGSGFSGTDRDDYTDPDTAMTAYLNAKIKLHPKMFIMPEVGMIDEMEDKMGNVEGSRMYFGLNLQADFDLSVK
jgi:hypothetical protein